MNKFKFKRLAFVGIIFIIIGIVGSWYSLSQSQTFGGILGILSQPYGFYSLISIFVGLTIIGWGFGKKLRGWVGLD